MIAYSAVISTCEKGQSVRMATHLLQEMLLQYLLRNMSIYSSPGSC